MPMLDNQRHERFAQALAAGMSQTEAYAEAGYSPDRSNATRLTANDSIVTRVTELQQRAAAGLVITRQYLLERQHGLMEKAEADAEYAAANTALRQLATLAGLYTEQSERRVENVTTQEQRDASVAAALSADT